MRRRDELDVLQMMLRREIERLLERHVAARPRLQAEFRAGRFGCARGDRQRKNGKGKKGSNGIHRGRAFSAPAPTKSSLAFAVGEIPARVSFVPRVRQAAQ